MVNRPAEQLNESIKSGNPHVYDMLSTLGKEIHFPKEGILSQSAEAVSHAKSTTRRSALRPKAAFRCIWTSSKASCPPISRRTFIRTRRLWQTGARTAWLAKMKEENPSLEGKSLSSPIVTNALTHGLSIVADLFVDEGDAVIFPDKNWENYELTFGIRRHAEIVNYPLFTDEMTFNSQGLREALLAQKTKAKRS